MPLILGKARSVAVATQRPTQKVDTKDQIYDEHKIKTKYQREGQVLKIWETRRLISFPQPVFR